LANRIKAVLGYYISGVYVLVTLNLTSEKRLRLRNLANFQTGDMFGFLGFSLNLATGEFQDDLQKGKAAPEVSNPTMHHQITE
jgi:hypothetical protein